MPPRTLALQDRRLRSRVVRAKAEGELDLELEAAFQRGVTGTDDGDLGHLAFFVHASVGYTFAVPYGQLTMAI